MLHETGSFVPFICITETWLKSYITDSQVKIPNYNVYRADRAKRVRGGALIYVHDSLSVSGELTYDDGICEGVILTIDSLNTIVASVYRPPGAQLSSFMNLTSWLQQYLDPSKSPDTFINGDFNFPNIDWETQQISKDLGTNETSCAQALLNFMSFNFLSQIIDKPTRLNNTLDLTLTNRHQYVIDIESSPTRLSDHNLVCVQLAYDARKGADRGPSPKVRESGTFYELDLNRADMNAIKVELDQVDWTTIKNECPTDDGGTAFAEKIHTKVLEICTKHSPKKQDPQSSLYKTSKNRRILNRRKRKLRARLKCLESCYPNSHQIPKIKDDISVLAVQIRDAIEQDIYTKERRATECLKTNPRYFFSYAKQFSKLKSNIGPLKDTTGTIHSNPVKMANLLQDQYSSVFSNPNNPLLKDTTSSLPQPTSTFHTFDFDENDVIEAIDEVDSCSATAENDIPAKVIKSCKTSLAKAFTLLWKDSFNCSVIPKCYKEQTIAPIHKKDSKSDPANYRPISLTSHVIKIYERVMRKNLVHYLEENNLLTNKQHGFRKGRSCLTQLLKTYDSILNNFMANDETDIIYLDFAKAFDKVDHALLLKKLRHLGIGGKVYEWIKSFLSDRSQTVVVDGHKSRPTIVISGVPQGTVLGPILFLIYINDLETATEVSSANSFADDTRLSHKIETVEDTTLLQSDLNHVIEWSSCNNMELHEKKFEYLSYRLPANIKISDNLPFLSSVTSYSTPSGVEIERKHLVRDLGIHLSDDFTWTPHINKMVGSARNMAAWALGVFRDRSKPVMLQLYKSLIRSKLEYCCPLWNPWLVKDIQSIEDVQRHFTKRISGMSNMTYWDRLASLQLYSLQRRRERYILIHTWKVIQGIVPNDLNMTFFQHPRHGIRTKVPALNKEATSKAKTYYDNSFHVKAAKLWNILPPYVKDHKSLDAFKTALSAFLNKVPDRPPVTGYSTANHNSLLDWFNQSGGLHQM